jgi:hypothetical protein
MYVGFLELLSRTGGKGLNQLLEICLDQLDELQINQ